MSRSIQPSTQAQKKHSSNPTSRAQCTEQSAAILSQRTDERGLVMIEIGARVRRGDAWLGELELHDSGDEAAVLATQNNLSN